MRSSRSISSAEPALSVVVASNGAPGAVARCLDALAGQCDGVEVIVCEPAATADELRQRYPSVSWHVRAGALVPELWRDGILGSHGELVALTISPMLPAPDWVASVRAGLAGADAVGGAVEPGDGLRLADLAEYLTRYSRDMLPFAARRTLDLPGDNAGYRRADLDEVAETWADGFWEPDVHAALAARGRALVQDPAIVVGMGRSAGVRAFLSQRVSHGRAFGRSRGAGSSRAGNLVRLALTPVVPVVLLARTVRAVWGRRRLRLRLLASSPLLLAFDIAWAAGEARGHLDALRRR